MKTDDGQEPEGLALVTGGPTHRFLAFLGLHKAHPSQRLLTVVGLLALTWMPLVVLSLMTGLAFPGNVNVPFFLDPETNGRLLVALPLLELARAMVGISLSLQSRSFLDMRLVPDRQRAAFMAAQRAANRLRRSSLVEVVLVGVAYAVAIGTRLFLGVGAGGSSWERVGSTITPAGWWNMLVSLPLLYFLILRWGWVIFCWGRFLFQVSGLDLRLTSTHPDRVGGLGFLAWGVAAFAPLLTAMSAVVAAGLASVMYHDGVLLTDLKYDVLGFVAVAVVIVYAPLLSFLPILARCRFQGLLAMGSLILDHDRAFEKKWIAEKADREHDLVGNPDISSAADAGTIYTNVTEMWLLPFDLKAFAVLVMAAMAPFAILLPIKDFLLWFGDLLV